MDDKPTPFPEFGGSTPDERAYQLMWSMLTPAERQQMSAYGYVEIISRGGRRYRLYHQQRVWYIMNGRTGDAPKSGLCVFPYEIVHGQGMCPPGAEILLALLLHIKTDERGFLRVACGHNEL